jgi:hypothetical protein
MSYELKITDETDVKAAWPLCDVGCGLWHTQLMCRLSKHTSQQVMHLCRDQPLNALLFLFDVCSCLDFSQPSTCIPAFPCKPSKLSASNGSKELRVPRHSYHDFPTIEQPKHAARLSERMFRSCFLGSAIRPQPPSLVSLDCAFAYIFCLAQAT